MVELIDAEVRLEVYRRFVESGRAATPVELADRFSVAPVEVEDSLRRLESISDALVLLPGSPYVWMAEPFSAVPTSFEVRATDGRGWWGNCIWDALAILALVDVDGSVLTACPDCGRTLHVDVVDGEVESIDDVVHFAVPRRDWWCSIGFT